MNFFLGGGGKEFRVDRQVDMTKLTVPFRNFANEPKNGFYYFDLQWTSVILYLHRRNKFVCVCVCVCLFVRISYM